jgi:hypothetical protein
LRGSLDTEHARDFVSYCFDITEGLYNTGSYLWCTFSLNLSLLDVGVGAGNELEQVYPADAQLVPVLTDISFFPVFYLIVFD